MQQVLFRIPGLDWPIYGYGMMLFVAFFFCCWLASWLAKKEGIPAQTIWDMGTWIFICGIAGARITYMVQSGVPLKQFFLIWEGGLVFYGSAIGGVVGYFGAYYFFLRKHHVSTWKMADICAPCAALGLCLGRIGCLLNGCCYGNVACPDCPAIGFPLPAHPRFVLVQEGLQTAAGFTLGEGLKQVGKVEPNSQAYAMGLRDGDEILEIDGRKADLTYLSENSNWPRGKNDLVLKVRHTNGHTKGQVEQIGPFVPFTIGLHPTQIYESISTGILFFLLMAYFPYRPRDGAVMVLFMLCYAVHRFLNEKLRNDTDPVAFGMTLSQNISIIVLVSGLFLALWLWLHKLRVGVELPPSV